MLETLREFILSLPTWLQWAGVIGVAAIPWVESYVGAALGVVAGVTPWIAIPAAIVGNTLSMVAIVSTAHAARESITTEPATRSPRRERLRRLFDTYGVPGVSLLGQTILPSQLTSAAMVSFGAPKQTVMFWQVISIVLWGVLFGVAASLGVNIFN